MNSRIMRGSVGLLLLVCQLWAGPVVHAQNREGIRVHGHWVIDIRQPDGTLVRHHEFENGIWGGGTLTRILTRTMVPGSWAINVAGVGNPCAPGICEIWETNTTLSPGAGRFITLTATGDPVTNAITLSGSMKAPAAGTIPIVRTLIGTCAPNVTPNNCHNANSPYGFTEAHLATPLSVAANQTIEFTVTISFS